MARWLPPMVAAKEFRSYAVTPKELVSPEARAELQSRGTTIERYLASEKSTMLELMKQLPAREVAHDGGRLGYCLVAVGGYQERLRDLHGGNCSINGMTPIQIFEKNVLPRL